MRRSAITLLVTALCCGGWAGTAQAAKNGITPLAPRAGSTIPEGKSPTFRMRVEAPGTVWVHVCKSSRKRADGTICSTSSIGQARQAGDEFRYKPRYFRYESFWLNSPGTYYWQAHRIDCMGQTEDCKQEGPIVRFRVG